MPAQQLITDHETRYPAAYYSIDVDDPAAELARLIRQHEYQLWQALVPGPEEDFALAVADIRRVTGKGERQIETAIHAHTRIRELPYLRQLQELTYRLDQSRLVAIDEVLARINDENLLAELDRRLTVYLIATRPNQQFPATGLIRRRLNDWIRLLSPDTDLDADADSEDGEDADTPELDLRHGDDGRSYLDLDAPTADMLEIEALIKARATEKNVTYAAALLDLLRGISTVSVVLNVYRAHDVPEAPAYVFGTGWIGHRVTQHLAERADRRRDMDETAGKISSAYQTPEDIRAFVIGRDGVCRWPGHSQRADRCQMDHTIDFADGGETTDANLASLCQPHHNIKTDGRAVPVQVGEGVLVWLFEDGTWVSTEPEGPLSPAARRWVQTIGQRVQRRRERERAPQREEPEVPEPEGDEPEF